MVYQQASTTGAASQVFESDQNKDDADGDKAGANGTDGKDEDNILLKQQPNTSGEQAQMFKVL